MRKTTVLLALPVLALTAFGDSYNNYTGNNDYWFPLGYPNTATYGETFTAPTDGATDLTSFSFFLGDSVTSGDILLNGYIATWTGSNAGTLLYTSSNYDFANTGPAEITFNTGGLDLTSGGSYVMFLSISQNYGSSGGQAYISSGTATIPGGGFAYANNGGNFSSLFTGSWDASGLSPNWAIDAEFSSPSGVPEPGTFPLLGAGLLAIGTGIRRSRRA